MMSTPTLAWRVLAVMIAAGAFAMFVLALGHAAGGRAEATGEGTFTASMTVRNEETGEDLTCDIAGRIEGGSADSVTMAALPYAVSATIVAPPEGNNCYPAGDPAKTTIGRPDISGTFVGEVVAIAGLEGRAQGTFMIDLPHVFTDTLGELQTEAQQGISIDCEEIDLRTRPTMYTCTQVGETELFGSDLKATILGMKVEVFEPGYVKMPKGGYGPMDGSSPFGRGLMAGLAAFGALLVTGGATIAVRQRTR